MAQLTAFRFGAAGPWAVERGDAVCGAPFEGARERLAIAEAQAPGEDAPAHAILRGVASNVRYATRAERRELQARQAELGRAGATRAALLPISKSDAWWALAQDERRAIFEEQSRHHSIGLAYLPQIARKLYHGRDLGEPFDFLTWFEYAPEDEALFDALLVDLRASPEWGYVSRECDIRLRRA